MPASTICRSLNTAMPLAAEVGNNGSHGVSGTPRLMRSRQSGHAVAHVGRTSRAAARRAVARGFFLATGISHQSFRRFDFAIRYIPPTYLPKSCRRCICPPKDCAKDAVDCGPSLFSLYPYELCVHALRKVVTIRTCSKCKWRNAEGSRRSPVRILPSQC